MAHPAQPPGETLTKGVAPARPAPVPQLLTLPLPLPAALRDLGPANIETLSFQAPSSSFLWSVNFIISYLTRIFLAQLLHIVFEAAFNPRLPIRG